MAGFAILHLASNPRSRASWARVSAMGLTGVAVLAVPAVSVSAFAGQPLTAVLADSDINSGDPDVLRNMVFVSPERARIFEFADGSYMMHPSLLLDPFLAVPFLFVVPFLLWRVERSIAAQLLLGTMLLTTFAVYVPTITTFLGDKLVLPGQIWRLAWPIPLAALLTVGWMAWEGALYAGELLTGRNIRPGRAPFLPLALVCILAVAVAPAAWNAVGRVLDTRAVPRAASYPLDPAFLWMRDNIDEPAVVLAPDLENTIIPAYSSDANVASLRGNLILRMLPALEERVPGRIDPPRGALDVNRFFFGTTVTEAADTLRRYEADYVMLHASTPLDDQLPGLTPLDTPGERYSIYRVDRAELPG